MRIRDAVFCLVTLAVTIALAPAVAHAAHPRTYSVELSASWKASPPGIILRWRSVPPEQDGDFYIVNRKAPDGRWLELARLPSNKAYQPYAWIDTPVLAGHPYEYRVDRCEGECDAPRVIGTGYVVGGSEIPMTDRRGQVLLVVEAQQGLALHADIRQWMEDLVGDGWSVTRIDVKATQSAREVKDRILAVRNKLPLEAIVLFGHVPVPYSGDLAPDGHDNHQGAWPTDSYYVTDADGWTDSIVNRATARHDHQPERNYNVPGDGKFDQTNGDVPPILQMAGRIDLSNLPAFKAGETELLRNYLGKIHRFRFKKLTAEPFAEIENVLWLNGFADITYSSWAALCPVDGEIRGSFFDFAKRPERASHLWGAIYDYGAFERLLSNYARPDGIGGYGYSTQVYAESWNPNPTLESRALFNIMDGSYFGDWDCTNNLLRAPLANRRYGLTAIWNRYPVRFHRMAAGGAIGECVRSSQRHVQSLGSGPIGMNLMGDPTLRMHAAEPPSNLRVAQAAQGVQLDWTASPDATHGYLVYRAADKLGPYTRLTQSPRSETTFLDASVPAGVSCYMVRAVALQATPSGSYLNLSQGVFGAVKLDSAIANGPAAPVLSIATDGRTASLSWTRVRAASFRVYRGTVKGGPYRLIGEVPETGFHDPVLRADTTYFYVVTAVGMAGNVRVESPASNEVDTNTPPVVRMDSPADGAVFLPFLPVKLRVAFADDPERDPITSVEYFARDQAGKTVSLGKALTAPFDLTWHEPPLGVYALHAVVVDARGAGAATPAIQTTFRVTIAPGVTKVNISGTVGLEGCVDLKQDLRFEFRPCDGVSPAFRREARLGETGGFAFRDLPPNLYKVAIKGTKWLQKAVLVNMTQGSAKGVRADLFGGEVVTANNPEDNVVDVFDLDGFITHFGQSVIDHPDAYGADLNCNGIVDMPDLELIQRNMDRAGDP